MPNQSFKSLQRHWYAVLAKEGFKDIENNNLPEPDVKGWDSLRFKGIDPDIFKIHQFYFEEAEKLLLTHKFNSKIERKIWRLHSEGRSVRMIVKDCKGRLQKSMVSNIIRRIAKGIK